VSNGPAIQTETTTDARAAFRYPAFLKFQTARFFIVVATEMQAVAVGWQVYEITKRPLDLGLVGLAQFLPGIVLFLVSGHVADRFNRRNLLILCDVALPLVLRCCSRLLCAALFRLLPYLRCWCCWASCVLSTARSVAPCCLISSHRNISRARSRGRPVFFRRRRFWDRFLADSFTRSRAVRLRCMCAQFWRRAQPSS